MVFDHVVIHYEAPVCQGVLAIGHIAVLAFGQALLDRFFLAG